MEYEIFFAGVGGQGIQLVAKTLALAATDEDRHVMLNGVYGGEMRGGKSLATVVIGDAPLSALPVTASAAAAVVMNDKFWGDPQSRLRDTAVILADSQISNQLSLRDGQTLISVPATEIAKEIGNMMVTGMVLMAAFSAVTGLASRDTLDRAMRRLVPPHRAQHVAGNEAALKAGAAAVTALSHELALAIPDRSVA